MQKHIKSAGYRCTQHNAMVPTLILSEYGLALQSETFVIKAVTTYFKMPDCINDLNACNFNNVSVC